MSGGLATPAAAFGFSMEKILYIYIYISEGLEDKTSGLGDLRPF